MSKSLGEFILRSEVIKLYRTCMRSARGIPKGSRGDVVQLVREQFAMHRNKTEPYDIKFALSDGRAQLKMWEEMLGMAR